MPRIDMLSCMPFRAWNRLEPRTRDNEFDKELECGVHDALWMLTRQWQMGEMQAEDTGSAIFAKVKMVSTPVTKYKTANGPVTAFDHSMPFEQKIETINTEKDYQAFIESGFMLLSAFENAASELGVGDFDRNAYRVKLQELFPLPAVPAINAGDSRDTIIAKANILSNPALSELMVMGFDFYFNGSSVYSATNTSSALDALKFTLRTAFSDSHGTLIEDGLNEFRAWYKSVYDLPPADELAWIPSQLEYSCACALPQHDGTNLVLNAKEYYSGDLDWYNFDVSKDEVITSKFGSATADETALVKEELFTKIPVEARFAGAPNSRWWQFENGSIDLGNIKAEKTDLSKMITTEYALMYGNDWMLIPYTVPVGTLCEIKGIAVTDVFGEVNFIEAANQGETNNWAAWGMFNLSVADANASRNIPTDTRTFIPPATVKTLNGESLEEVRFVRGEMSNHVWAVETQLPDHTGFAIDGHNYALAFRDMLDQYENNSPLVPAGENIMFKYILGNTVPENWIPFIPVHEAGGNRAIRLKRASMPRLLHNEYSRVRPRTQLVREGINAIDEQEKAYYVNEEEVPRSGAIIKGNHQRTRWYNGKIAAWYGYRKHTGRGEGSSGLAYDSVTPVQRSEAK